MADRRQLDINLRAVKPVRTKDAGQNLERFKMKRNKLPLNFFDIRAEVGERGENHVAACAADALEVQDFHCLVFRCFF